MEVREYGEVDAEGYKPTNVEWIPCMRTSVLTGVSTGFGGGLLYFLFTSNGRRASQWGMGIYVVVTLGRYGQCRWRRSVARFEASKMKYALEQMKMREGTEDDVNLKAERSSSNA